MDAVVESVGIPGVSTRLNLCVENTQADPGRDGRICLARHKSQARKGTGNNNFPYSADHEQDWQSYLVDPYSSIRDGHTSSTRWPNQSCETKF